MSVRVTAPWLRFHGGEKPIHQSSPRRDEGRVHVINIYSSFPCKVFLVHKKDAQKDTAALEVAAVAVADG